MSKKMNTVNNILICPSCNKEKRQSEVLKLLQFNITESKNGMMEILESAEKGFLNWACDKCIETGKAIIGDPNKQNVIGFSYPYLAYYDKEKKCITCKQNFIFKKEEQLYWFEELKFIVWVKGNNCLECRKKIRKPKELNTKLSELVQKVEELSEDKLLELIQIYLQLQKIEKAKYYFSFLRKKIKKSNRTKDESLNLIRDIEMRIFEKNEKSS